MPITLKGLQSRMILSKLRERVSRTSRQPAVPAKPLAISQGICASAHAGGLTLLHIPSGHVFVCNHTAAWIRQGISRGLNLEGLFEEMSREYGIPQDVARRDTISLLSQMERHGLITRGSV